MKMKLSMDEIVKDHLRKMNENLERIENNISTYSGQIDYEELPRYRGGLDLTITLS